MEVRVNGQRGWASPARRIPSRGAVTITTAAQALSASRAYALPRNAIELRADDARLFDLADRLWHQAHGPIDPGGRPIRIMAALEHGAGPVTGLTESWTVRPDEAALVVGDQLRVTVSVPTSTITGTVGEALLSADPGLVARLVLEVPVAAVLQRSGYAGFHAAAVAGPRGVAVLRGGPGAGKSTLAVACWQAGMDLLGDESVLVARTDPDEILAAVRDPVLAPDAVGLLRVDHRRLVPSTERSGPKRRLNLADTSDPARRSGRRVATVVLGQRVPGPARLERLDPDTFLHEFRAGTIGEEWWAGPATEIEHAWSQIGAWRLSGAGDLGGAVKLLSELVGHVPHGGSRA